MQPFCKSTLAVMTLFLFYGIGIGRTQNRSFLPENLEPIRPSNMGQLQQLAMLGTGTIQAVSWSPDSQSLAFAGSAGIRLFDAHHLETPPQWFQGHIGRVNDVVFTADGSQLISVGIDQMVRRWDVKTGDELSSTCLINNGEGCISGELASIELSPDNTLLAIGGYNSISVWDSSLKGELFSSTKEKGEKIKFSDDGSLFAAIQDDGGRVSIWQIENGSIFKPLPEMDIPYIYDFSFSPQGKMIAVAIPLATNTPLVQVFDTTTGELITQFDDAYNVTIDPTGTTAASLSADFLSVVIWDLKTGKALHSFPIDIPPYSGVSEVSFSPDGTRIVVAYQEGSLSL